MTLRRIFPLLLLMLAFSAATFARQDAKQQLNDQLWEAARVGDAAAVKTLLDKGAEVDAKFRYGQTALFKAAERGHTEVVKVLLERGAQVNLRDTFYGATPMTWALNKSHVGVVRALLEKGAEEVGDVLMTGVRENKTEFVSIALDTKRAKPEQLTAALAAATNRNESPAIIELLKKSGAQPPFEVDAATLQSYAGMYKSATGGEITVAHKDGKFTLSAPGQGTFVAMALDKTTFRPVDFDGITVSFVVEGDKATSFNFKQGPNTTLYKRIEETKQP